jgi:hypothetical protein
MVRSTGHGNVDDGADDEPPSPVVVEGATVPVAVDSGPPNPVAVGVPVVGD